MMTTGLKTLCKREIVRFLVVFQQTVLPPLLTSLLFLFIFGLSVGKNIELSYLSGNSYLSFIVPGLVTLHLISAAFENTSSSLFISRWHNHIQELLLSPLSYLEMVIGLLAGGIARAVLVSVGVYIISSFFEFHWIHNLPLTCYFIFTISILFSCAGLMAALWAENFGMLSVWNIYCVTPLVFLGGVFNPISMLPDLVQKIALFNPLHYLVSGMRYAMLGVEERNIWLCVLVAGILSLTAFAFTVHLFRIGYKLRS